MKITLLHNIVAPYRLPLFEQIGLYHQLTVLFAKGIDNSRKWPQDTAETGFKADFLKHISIRPFVFNPLIFWTLARTPTDVYILIDNEENSFTNLCIILFTWLSRKPYVLWSGHIPVEHGGVHPAAFGKGLTYSRPLRWMYFAIINRAHGILYKYAASYLAYSDASRRYLESKGAPATRIFVGTQAKPTNTLPAPSKRITLPNELNLLYIGYLRPEKGVDMLIRAVMRSPSSKVALHIVGDGPERGRLEALAKSSKNIVFYPYAQDVETANWFTSVDLCVLPTYHDPWAHVVTESLYYGTPVLVTASAAASSVIKSGVTGFVIKAGDQAAVERIICGLIAEPGKIKTMKRDIRQADLSRLYDVAQDASNFMQAIALADENRSGMPDKKT